MLLHYTWQKKVELILINFMKSKLYIHDLYNEKKKHKTKQHSGISTSDRPRYKIQLKKKTVYCPCKLFFLNFGFSFLSRVGNYSLNSERLQGAGG